jgi:D-3-phosphoglycerate dehydrogenase
MKPKILIVGDLWVPCKLIREEFQPLAEKGFDLSWIDWELESLEQLTAVNRAVERDGPDTIELPGELLKAIEKTNILAVQFCPVSRRLLERCNALKLVGVMRAGTENIDIEAAKELGIGVLNVRGRNARAVAEFTLGLLLTETRNISRSHLALTKGIWRKEFLNSDAIPELQGKVFGIIGMGEVGSRLVRLLAGFEPGRVLVYDPFVAAEEVAARGAEQVSLEKLCRESDFISMNYRLSEETRHLISHRELEWMQPHAYIINTARAELIDEEALIKALNAGRIGGAALDVFEQEPLPADSPLLRMENVTLTSHLAGTTSDSFLRSARILTQDILRLLDGKQARYAPVRDLVDTVDWPGVFGA